jgi:branched-chain amino acid transport system substrate-binding protein
MALALAVWLAAPLAAWLLAPPPAEAGEVKVALVAPLSGRWARQGQFMKYGAEMAIDEINAQGGIKALGGAKMVIVPTDAGDSVEKATSAAQRVLTREKVVGASGSWLSSFTMGATEVSERLQIPWMTLSFADTITERGFKYVFQTSPVSSKLAEQGLDLAIEMAKGQGVTIKKMALVGDNTAAIVTYFKALREKLLAARGIALVVDEVFTPPLPDATSVAQKLRAAQPDLIINGATNFADCVQVLQKMKEFGVKVPQIGVGAQFLTPEYRQAVGVELMAGFMSTAASHPLKGQEEMVRRFKERSKEPFMMQDSVSTYAEIWMLKEAVERAKSDDPKKVRDAVATMDLTTGPAAQTLLPNRIRFDERGRRVDATAVIVQWQGEEPYTIYPARVATKSPIWPK